MPVNDSLYCKVYVEAPVGRDAFLAWLQAELGGTLERRTLTGIDLEIDVSENEERIPPPDTSSRDAFLYFRFVLDVVPSQSSSTRGAFVNAIAGLLDALWREQGRAVAACDFEAELPMAGGIAMLAPA